VVQQQTVLRQLVGRVLGCWVVCSRVAWAATGLQVLQQQQQHRRQVLGACPAALTTMLLPPPLLLLRSRLV
jgi:hypothetical protein